MYKVAFLRLWRLLPVCTYLMYSRPAFGMIASFAVTDASMWRQSVLRNIKENIHNHYSLLRQVTTR